MRTHVAAGTGCDMQRRGGANAPCRPRRMRIVRLPAVPFRWFPSRHQSLLAVGSRVDPMRRRTVSHRYACCIRSSNIQTSSAAAGPGACSRHPRRRGTFHNCYGCRIDRHARYGCTTRVSHASCGVPGACIGDAARTPLAKRRRAAFDQALNRLESA
jgi:hypothetical protein